MRTAELQSSAGPIELSIHPDFESVRSFWVQLERTCCANAYASIDFVEPWAEHVGKETGTEPRIVLAKRHGKPLAIVPLGLARKRGVPFLVPLSDTHSNMNGGIFASKWDVDPKEMQSAVLGLIPEAEGLFLSNLPAPNGHPLLADPRPSVHEVHGGSLADGFDGHLSRVSGRRKRKKHRQGARRFAEAGGWQVRRVNDASEAIAMLDEARDLFARRFQAEGIADPFAAPPVRAFLAEVLGRSVRDERPAMAIWVLEVAGEVLAVQAGGGTADHFSLMFTVYRPSALDPAAPGDFLLHEVIEAAARMGYRSFDLGRGREPYKTSWCDEVVALHDVRVARSLRARLLLILEGSAASLRKRVRGNERLWGIAQTVRRWVGSRR